MAGDPQITHPGGGEPPWWHRALAADVRRLNDKVDDGFTEIRDTVQGKVDQALTEVRKLSDHREQSLGASRAMMAVLTVLVSASSITMTILLIVFHH